MKRSLKQSLRPAPGLKIRTVLIYISSFIFLAGIVGLILFVYLNGGLSRISKAAPPAGIALPVEMMFFKGKAVEDEVQLEWATASEKKNDYFLLERSSDGVDFVPFAEVKGAGYSEHLQHYFALDKGYYADVTYYRLKQVDYDRGFSYSHVIIVNTGTLKRRMRVYPNPASYREDHGGMIPVHALDMPGTCPGYGRNVAIRSL